MAVVQIVQKNSEDDGSDPADFPNLQEYPLFDSHGLNITDDTIRNRAVHELLKHMGGNTILYHQMSHHNGALIRIPSASSAIGYTTMLKRKENFMKELIKFIGESLNQLLTVARAMQQDASFNNFPIILKRSSKK